MINFVKSKLGSFQRVFPCNIRITLSRLIYHLNEFFKVNQSIWGCFYQTSKVSNCLHKQNKLKLSIFFFHGYFLYLKFWSSENALVLFLVQVFIFCRDMAYANDQNYDDLIEDEQFLEWFWSKNNGNKLIQFLNKRTQKEHNDELRRERYPPFVYGLVLNDMIYIGTNSRGNAFNKKFRIMKIGFSELINDRINRITNKFNDLAKQISEIFIL